MGDIAFIVLAFSVSILNLPPLVWHIQHGNAGAASLGIWIMILNIIRAINGIIWFDNVDNIAPVWCDISSKLLLAGPTAFLVSAVSMASYLARVVGHATTILTSRERRARQILDYSVCFGVPVLVMATQIVYQPNRYGIMRGTGCEITAVLTWPTFILWLIWLPLLALIGSIYGVYVLYHLVRHRREFSRVVTSSNSAFTFSRTVRLGLLTAGYLFIALPMDIYNVIKYVKAAEPPMEYNWDVIHENIGTILYVPLNTHENVAAWFQIVVGGLVLIFFGFGNESRVLYAKAARLIGLQRVSRFIDPFKPPVNNKLPDKDSLDIRLDAVQRRKESESIQYNGPFYDAHTIPTSEDNTGVYVTMTRHDSVL